MKISDVFPSRFLSHDDLEEDITVTIERVWLEDMQRPGSSERVKKPCIEFDELDKPMVLNKTNWMRIATLHGDESDGWKGRQVVLTIERVRFGAELVEAVRIKAVNRKGAGAPAASVKYSGDWRKTAVHFGKNKGKMLGELPKATLAWYQDEWQPKPNPATKSFTGTDLQLRAALDASMRDATAAPQLPLPSGGGDDDVPF